MHYSIYLFIVGLLLLSIYAVLASRFSYFRNSAKAGLNIWASLLPTISLIVLAFIIIVNFGTLSGDAKKILSLRPYLTTADLVTVAICLPLLAMRLGYIISAAMTLFLLQRILFGFVTTDPGTGFVILVSCLSCLAVLGDKLPWFDPRRASITAQKFREILIIFSCFSALTIIFTSLIKLPLLSRWLLVVFNLTPPPEAVVGILVVLLSGWMIIALGLTRHILLPFVLLPSLMLVAFVTDWPTYALAITFAVTICLAIATAERRINNHLYLSRSSTLFS